MWQCHEPLSTSVTVSPLRSHCLKTGLPPIAVRQGKDDTKKITLSQTASWWWSPAPSSHPWNKNQHKKRYQNNQNNLPWNKNKHIEEGTKIVILTICGCCGLAHDTLEPRIHSDKPSRLDQNNLLHGLGTSGSTLSINKTAWPTSICKYCRL